MKQLLAQLQGKGITATGVGVVNWSSDQREAQIDTIAAQCVKALKG
jgi:hypothetical protein